MAKRMAEQMELFEPVERGFEEGGLMDEGGTVDPVSGNDVPPGSTQEEVRDDIPAQLSEGEFVFPADVVRYIGLETLMRMRQEAKQGLAQMEAMGQMGNSEEASMPDNLPFDMYDLEVEDEQDELNFAVGGVVPMQGFTGIGGYQPAAAPTTGFAPAPTVAAPVQAASAQPMQAGTFQPAGTAFTPTTVQAVTPTFQETIGAGVVGVDYEMVEYVNEAGQVIQLRKSKSTGEMLDPIPEGYKLKSEQVESAVTTPTTVETAQVTDDGGRDNQKDDGLGPSGARVAWGGTTEGAKKGLKVGSTQVGIGYTKVDPATGKPYSGLKGVPNALDFANVIGGLTFGDELPAGYAATMTIDNVTTPINNQFFNEAKKSGYMGKSADLSLDIARTNVQAANIMQEKYGLQPRNQAKAINDIAREAARSDVGIAELAKDYGIDIETIKDNPFGFGKNYADAVAKAVEAANKGNDAGATPFTADDIKAGHAARTAIEAHNDAVNAKAAAQRAADKAAGNDYRDVDDGGYDDSGFDDSDPGTGGGAQGGGYGGGTDCLTEDMKVNLNGVIDFVTNIKVGDIIDNYKVKEVLHKHMREGYYTINNELKISNDHPVLANGTWTRPEDLVVGDSINGIPVSSLEYVEQLTPTVSIVIDGESFDVHTENNIYTVHGRYREVRQEAA